MMKKKVITALIGVAVFIALILIAQFIVNNVNIVELLKSIHGG